MSELREDYKKPYSQQVGCIITLALWVKRRWSRPSCPVSSRVKSTGSSSGFSHACLCLPCPARLPVCHNGLPLPLRKESGQILGFFSLVVAIIVAMVMISICLIK